MKTLRARVEKMVEKATAVPGSFGKRVLDNKAIVTLLLREHRRVVRVVKEYKRAIKLRAVGFERLDGYLMACDDLLAALRGER